MLTSSVYDWDHCCQPLLIEWINNRLEFFIVRKFSWGDCLITYLCTDALDDHYLHWEETWSSHWKFSSTFFVFSPHFLRIFSAISKNFHFSFWLLIFMRIHRLVIAWVGELHWFKPVEPYPYPQLSSIWFSWQLLHQGSTKPRQQDHRVYPQYHTFE